MILKDFETLWQFATRHGPIQQDKTELKYIYNLIKDYHSYLEIGSAEGASLHVLGHGKQFVAYVDIDEDHTRVQRNEVIDGFKRPPQGFHGNSHSNEIINQISSPVDVVFIDAGHTYEDVIADAMSYGLLATKCLLFHDVQLPPVAAAVDWYVAQQGWQDRYSAFINSTTFGYGIIKLC